MPIAAAAGASNEMADDPFNLNRFVEAQASVIDTVLLELKRGKKQSHWMWFVFPQIAGLGFSSMAQKYAISSLDEARAYLGHPVLGDRLRKCVELVLQVENRSAHQIFGSPDDMKFRSSLTLFSEATGEEVFLRALDEYFDGVPDSATPEIMARSRQH
jgi:uncharacterized protein (DUF1810 family)